ncbi:MAG: hypothetical protein JW747_09570, partial [Candidatus Aminicenantes bacterium]|nr:hypothetical protein [Candidatus Aminicenantes bacterium]
MNGIRGIRINLASEPLKNTRFFRALMALLLVALAGVLLPTVVLSVRQQIRAVRLGKEAASLRESVSAAREESGRLEARGKEL